MTGWTDADKGEFISFICDFWPNTFTRSGQRRNRTITEWIDVLGKFQFSKVKAALRQLKRDEEDDFAPKLAAVRKALEAGGSPVASKIPEIWFCRSVTVGGHTWQAEPQGCYGPGGFWLWYSKPMVPMAVLEAFRTLYAGPQEPPDLEPPEDAPGWHRNDFDPPEGE